MLLSYVTAIEAPVFAPLAFRLFLSGHCRVNVTGGGISPLR